jgi:hypothetical protein
MEPSADDTAPEEQNRTARTATALMSFAAITGTVAVVGLLVLSLRGGSVSMSTPAGGLTVNVNPPH